MTETEQAPAQHHAVPHPAHLRARQDAARYERRFYGRVAIVNDWAATHLGIVFGSVWMVWVFFVWPLAAQYMDALIQAKTSYYAQSWVQLFALPLFVYIGNKLQRSSDAQSEVMHQALTHIATVSDENKILIQQNTQLTQQNNQLTAEVHGLVTALAGQPQETPAATGE